MDYPTINENKIPQRLKDLTQWTLWQNENGRKVPVRIAGNGRVVHQTNETKYSFAYAKEMAEKHGLGLGIWLGNGLAGFDMDKFDFKVKSIADLPRNIRRFLRKLDTYAEISVSEHGIHVLGFYKKKYRGKNKNRKTQCEFYVEKRFFIVTGWSLNDKDINPDTKFDPILKQFINTEEEKEEEDLTTDTKGGWTGTDDELVNFFDNNKLTPYGMVWRGDHQTFHNKFNGDYSAMDQALFNYLVFFIGNDPERIERIAFRSPWYENEPTRRDKWDRRDYINRTIKRALTDHKGDYFQKTGNSEEYDDKNLLEVKEVNTDNAVDLINDMPCELIRNLALEYLRVDRYPQPVFALGFAITISGFMLGRGYQSEGKLGCMQSIFIGPSGCGKNTVLSFKDQMLSKTDQIDRNMGIVASGPGLEDALYNTRGHTACLGIDEILESGYTGSDPNSRMRSAKFREYSTSGPREVPLRSKAGDENVKTMKAPFLTVIGTTTSTSFQHAYKSNEIGEGNINRAYYFKTVEELPDYNPNSRHALVIPHEYLDMCEHIQRFERELNTDDSPPPLKQVHYDNETEKVYMEDQKEFVRIVNKHYIDDEMGRQLHSRKLENARQIAMILAVWNDVDGIGATINLEEYTWAKRFLEWHRHNIGDFLKEHVTQSEMDFGTSFKKWHNTVLKLHKKRSNCTSKDSTHRKSYGSCLDLQLIPEPMVRQLCKIYDTTLLKKFEQAAVEAHVLYIEEAQVLIKHKKITAEQKAAIGKKKCKIYILKDGFDKFG